MEIFVGRNIEGAIRMLRESFDPVRRELRDREYFMSRTRRRKLKDIRAASRMRKKCIRYLQRRER